MKKFSVILRTILISTLMLTVLPAWSMENETPLSAGNSYSLANLPTEVLMQIFPHCLVDENNRSLDHDGYADDTRRSTLVTDIQKFMQLSSMCTTFNRLLTPEVIGKFCKTYSKEYKRNMVKRLLKKMSEYTYYLDPNSRLVITAKQTKQLKEKVKSLLIPALIAVYEDVYESPLVVHTSYCDSSLWKAALLIDDAEFLTILIKDCHLQTWYIMDTAKTPPCFYAKTIETAQVIIDNWLYRDDYDSPNILWQVIHYGYPVEVMELYIKDRVNLKWLNNQGNCLLHELVHLFYQDKEDNNFIKKVELLLTKMPDKINTINKNDFTPLDIVQNQYAQLLHLKISTAYKSEAEETEQTNSLTEEFEPLISLLKEHGCLTAQEVAYNATWAGKFQKKVAELYNIIQI